MQENMSPAPWYIEEFNDFIVVFDDSYEVVCHIDYNHRLERGKDRENAMANARLIVDAPEMYKLLGKVRDYFENRETYGYGVDERVRADLLREIKKVMRKARGEK